MTATVEQLLARVGAKADKAGVATTALEVASALVTVYVADANPAVPEALVDEATLRVAVDAYNRAVSPNGVLMSVVDDEGDGSTVVLRTPADPLTSARLLLEPTYIAPLGFA